MKQVIVSHLEYFFVERQSQMHLPCLFSNDVIETYILSNHPNKERDTNGPKEKKL